MIIRNGSVFGEDGKYTVRDIYIENHKIVASREEVTDVTEIDASGRKVIPGLIDIHSTVRMAMIFRRRCKRS